MDTSIKILLKMPLLALNNTDIYYHAESFTRMFYSVTKSLHKVRQVKLIDKWEFAKIALDKNSETFVDHVTALEAFKLAIVIHLSRASLLPTLQ